MRIRSPSLPELHAFIGVVESGSFSQAAVRLTVTQGAVSRAVMRLEARLGIDLLERHPSGVRPTAAGQAYYDRIHRALSDLEAAVPMAEPSKQPKEQLRVAAISSLNMRWLVPRLPSLAADEPRLSLAFKAYLVDDDFLRPDVDCWIQTRPTSSSRWPRHVQATYLIGREVVPICHPDVAGRIKAPEDFLRFPLLHHVNYPDNWALWFRTQGLSTGKPKLGPGFDLAAGIIEAVGAQMGVAVMQRCLVERELAEGRLAVPIDRPVSTGRGYYFCVLRSRADTPAIAGFKAWLLKQAAE